jgi:hypothetical protein
MTAACAASFAPRRLGCRLAFRNPMNNDETPQP